MALAQAKRQPPRHPLAHQARTAGRTSTGLLAVTLGLGLSLAGCHEGKKDENKASLPPKGEVPAAKAEPAPPADGNSAAADASGQAQAAPAASAPAAASPTPAAAPAAPAKASAPSKDGGQDSGSGSSSGGNADYRLTGQVTAVRRSQIAFRISGVIKNILVKPGVRAKAGEPLATLDERDFMLHSDLAKARVDQAKVQLDEATKELKREQELKVANASTSAVFDKVKSGADQTRLGVRLAELDLENAQYALRDTKLTAPYDCVVAEQFKYEGEAVQPVPPAPVFEVYDTAEPELTLSVPERLMGQVKIGSHLNIIVPSASYTGKGEIVRLVPVISEKSRTFQVIAHFTKYDAKIVPGTYAEATME